MSGVGGMGCKRVRRREGGGGGGGGGVGVVFFFFKQKTAYEIRNCDWSSDVCSSDLRISGLRMTLPYLGSFPHWP